MGSSLQDVLSHRGIRFRVSQDGRVHLNCPFCIERGKETDTKQRLCIHSREYWGKCVRCDWKARRAVTLVLSRLGITDAVNGFSLPDVKTAELVKLPDDFQVLTKTYDELDRQALDYLLKRGITREQIEANKIGVSYSGRYAYRILFPVFIKKRLVSINARQFMSDKEPKYLNSRGEKYLYDFDPSSATTILSEGVFKALRIDRVTSESSAALLGHSLSETQFKQILDSKCNHLIFYPDLDYAGRLGFVKMANQLTDSPWQGHISIIWPVTQPADEAPLEDLRTLLKTPVPYSWKISQTLSLK